MIALFKQKSPVNIVLLLIFGLLLKMPLFLYPKNIIATEQDGMFFQYLIALLPPNVIGSAIICSVIAFILLYGQALMVNYLINEQRMTNKQTYLPAMSFLLITSLFPEWNYLSAPLIASTLIIWIFIKLFKLYNRASANSTIYNIGLLTGLGSFLFFPSLAFVICILLGIMILRPFRFSDIILLLFGVLTPYYFYSVYLFLNDKLVLQNVFPSITVQVPKFKNTIWLAINVLLLGVPFLMGGYYIQTLLRKMLIQVRKNWSILLLFLLLALGIPFINTTHSFHNWVLVAAPFAAFHTSAYLYPQRKWIPLVLFFLTVAFVLLQQYVLNNWQ